MLRLLALLGLLLKWAAWLTLARLLSTAFGWEFGVSRQYLRLLEWLLQSGQARIAKVDSEHRMRLDELADHLTPEAAPEASGRRVVVAPRTLDLGSATPNGGAQQQELPNGGGRAQRQRKVSILGGHSALLIERRGENGPAAASRPEDARKRRVSTPDGPPIFLLDDEEADEEEEEEGERRRVTDNDEKAGLSSPAEEKERDHSISDQRVQLVSSATNNKEHHHHHKHEFHLDDAALFVVKGVSAICDDQVTKRFTPEQLKTWNLLTRTNERHYQFMSRSLGLYWLAGLLIRYALLLPLRIMFTLAGTVWLIASMTLIGLAVPRAWRNKPFELLSRMSFRMLSCGITSRLKFHNRQFRARPGDICVANHTSPLDVVLLACDNCYALVGQRHGGLLGLLECALSRATNHVWFDRNEMRDRQLVTQRLKEHVSSKTNLPVLIFPEGTCINNSAVMMFRKGSFETSARICPAAIKYDSRFGDPFWNSSQQGYVEYLLMMMSSWAIKCDVWYLPPMERLAHESPAEFAQRVKAEIAKQGGLEDLAWDGQLKRSSIKPTWLFQQQEDYAKRLKLE